MQHTNRLSAETSPYLLQHAHNPVDWYPWGQEALAKARAEDKPVLVSIGYSSCHWCHVMERESFEDPETARLMNTHFINIKIDREERPDLDHIYMDAVQAMTGSGGWPLNVFLTPSLKPFYGGTYFPPVPFHNRPSWKDVLYGVARAYTEKREEVEQQAAELVAHLVNANSFGVSASASKGPAFDRAQADLLFENLMKQADHEWGGFGRAPKFPQTFAIRYLLQYAWRYNKDVALKHACLSLDKMIQGGIYDHIGGGFARYSTDTEWLAPHFEKMLYDNALLVIALSEAFQLTGNLLYEQCIRETMHFLQLEMMSEEAVFYAAIDADSEGVEGKFYTWSHAEVQEVLKEDASLFCRFYDITEKGNWEHVSIPWIQTPLQEFCEAEGLNSAETAEKFADCRARLLQTRSGRIRPLLDDKVLLGWNALMNMACSYAFMATGDDAFRRLAVKNMEFLLRSFRGETSWLHSFQRGEARIPAFCDDYAYLIQALLLLQEITSETRYLQLAVQIQEEAINLFGDEESGLFFYTSTGATDIIVRKKELYDGAVPSGNSIMAWNLQYLGVATNQQAWIGRAARMMAGVEQAAVRYPVSFGYWAHTLLSVSEGIKEIVILGSSYAKDRDEVLRLYLPGKIVQAAAVADESLPLLAGKKTWGEHSLFYICEDYACQKPAESLLEFKEFLKAGPIKQ